MIPEFPIDPVIETVDPGQLRVLFADEVAGEGTGDNRCYMDLSGLSWEEVLSILATEELLLQRADHRSTTIEEFEDAAEDLDDEECDGIFSLGLDLGVVGAVAALSAAGCVSTTSCRGHPVRGEPAPLIRFTTDEDRLPIVIAAARAASCGLLLDDGGMLQLHDRSVRGFLRFARQLRTFRSFLERLAPAVFPDSSEEEWGEVSSGTETEERFIRRRARSRREDYLTVEEHPGQGVLFDYDFGPVGGLDRR